MTKQEFIDQIVIHWPSTNPPQSIFESAEELWDIRQQRILAETKKFKWEEEASPENPGEKRYFFDMGDGDQLTIVHEHDADDKPKNDEFRFYLDLGESNLDAVFQGEFKGTLDEAKAHATSECREWIRSRYALLGGLW